MMDGDLVAFRRLSCLSPQTVDIGSRLWKDKGRQVDDDGQTAFPNRQIS